MRIDERLWYLEHEQELSFLIHLLICDLQLNVEARITKILDLLVLILGEDPAKVWDFFLELLSDFAVDSL